MLPDLASRVRVLARLIAITIDIAAIFTKHLSAFCILPFTLVLILLEINYERAIVIVDTENFLLAC
jgi:hypothetical protein